MSYCETCKYRDNDGRCQNEKLVEEWGQDANKREDMLIYDYSEGGGFWVGPRFGCVHHTKRR